MLTFPEVLNESLFVIVILKMLQTFPTQTYPPFKSSSAGENWCLTTTMVCLFNRKWQGQVIDKNFYFCRSGKSSIQRVVFHKMSPNETLFLESTNAIHKENVSNSSFVQFAVWDFPGIEKKLDQESYDWVQPVCLCVHLILLHHEKLTDSVILTTAKSGYMFNFLTPKNSIIWYQRSQGSPLLCTSHGLQTIQKDVDWISHQYIVLWFPVKQIGCTSWWYQ